MGAKTTVECYSGHIYAQEPRAFVWQGARLVVEAVERVGRTPSGPFFHVRAADGRRFRLSYDEAADAWECEPLGKEQAAP